MSVAAPSRRATELGLAALVAVIVIGAYVLTSLAELSDLPADLGAFLAMILGLLVAAHVAVRRLAPHATPVLLPLAATLNGLGFVLVARLDRDLGRVQALWIAVAVLAFVSVLVAVPRVRVLERYRYTLALLGVGALMLPLAPGIGREAYGSRLWLRVGPLNFQPGEAAKLLLVIFLAAYLVEKRELLSIGTRRVGRLLLPDPRHLGPLLAAWGVSLVIMVMQKDLGSSLLFFAVFLAMLYVATARLSYLVAGSALFAAGAVTAFMLFSHVQDRVDVWLDPWPDIGGRGQLLQALFSFGSGGVAGTGLGLGSPTKIPQVATDFVFAAAGEELGLLGATAIILLYALLVGVGLGIALRARQPFAQLLAAGLTAIFGFQTFIILGGVTRLIPLTGITLPFMSYGGSSLVVNFMILALLIRISHEAVGAEPASAPAL